VRVLRIGIPLKLDEIIFNKLILKLFFL